MEHFKEFTAVADTVAGRQASQANKLASTIGYHMAPHQVGHEGQDRPPPDQIINSRQIGSMQQQMRAQLPPVQAPTKATPQKPVQAPTKATPQKPVYVALYDYTEADDDEITIKEGDRLSDVTVIDEGWMEGTNTSSGKFGMFPSNYVQKV